MTKSRYPLLVVLQVKERRVDQALLLVKEKEEELEKVKKVQEELEKKRDEANKHRQDKLEQLRHHLDTGSTAPKIRQMKSYLDVVKGKLKEREKEVADHLPKVEEAKTQVKEAKKLLRKRRLEVDKLKTHQAEWEKEAARALRREEEKVEDELGSILYTRQESYKKKHRGNK